MKIEIQGVKLTEGFAIHVNGVEFAPVQVMPDPDPPQKQEFNAGAFFSYIRTHLFWGSLSQSQVDGFNAIGAYLGPAFPESDPRRIEKMAYCLATFQWETASTMKPIAEYGGKNARYAPWYGRGYVQLTWEENYAKQQKKLQHHPMRPSSTPYRVHSDRELALHPDTSALISIYGMIDGDFTGVGLDDYITPTKVDYRNARRIVNGTDKAAEIADMAELYENAIREGYA